MFLDDLLCDVKIERVLNLYWERRHENVSFKKFNSISLRFKGCAAIHQNGKTMHLQTGSILFVPEYSSYSVDADDEEDMYTIHFKSNSKFDGTLELFSNIDFMTFSKLFLLCHDVWNKKEEGYYYKTLSIFYNIIELLSKSTARELTDKNYLKIKPAIDYLKTHFNEYDLSVVTLANIVNMSDTYFRKLFFEVYHTTPKKYINDMRISYAKELIESEYYTLSQVAEMSGFNDIKYFYTVFKKYADIKPGDFMKFLK